MKCVIHGPNVKFFARALYSLAKIGEDLYLEAQSDGLALRSTNSARSAFMCYLFNPPFFSGYYLTSDREESDKEAGDGEEVVAKCKLSMKAILMAFRSMGSLDKTVESCTISISDKLSKTKIELHCRYSVVKTYTLPFIECESIKARFNSNQGSNQFTAHAKVLTEVALNFLSNQEEVTMSVDESKFTMKNFVENEEDSKKTVHTEMSMTSSEFDFFSVAQKSTVTFCLKELRAFIGFADAYNLPVTCTFDTGGNPIVFTIQNPETLEGVLVLATLDGDVDEPDYPNVASTNRARAETQTATNQVASCNLTQSNDRPNLDQSNCRPNLNQSISQQNLSHSNFQIPSNVEESQASISFHSKRRISGQKVTPQTSHSRVDNLHRTAASIFGSRNEVSDGAKVSAQMSQQPLPDVRESAGSDKETQSSIVFRSKRHLSGGPKPKKSSYNENTDSESDTEDVRSRISESRNVTSANDVSQRGDSNDVTLRDSNDVTNRDMIDGTPPSKRAKFFFQRCFDATFNPNRISGTEKVLAPDTDEDE